MSKFTSLADALEAAIGSSDEISAVPNWLDTGYKPLNAILSGSYDKGLPYGRIVEVFGPSSSGKTLIATQAMIAAQKAGGFAGFCDHEGTFEMPFAKGLGLSDDANKWSYKRPDTWEESNTIALKAGKAIRDSGLIPPEAPIVWVFDSIAAMIPKSVWEKGIDEYSMNDTTALARVSSTTLKAVNQMVGRLNMTMIYLNQIRTKPGVVYGDPTTTPGGMAMEFYATVRLALGRKLVREERDGAKELVAQLVGITTKKNKLTRPFQEVDIRLAFDPINGKARFDYHTSLIDFLIAHGRLTGAGARINWLDGKSYFKKALSEKLAAESDGLTQLESLLPPLETLAEAA